MVLSTKYEYWDLGESPGDCQEWPSHNEKCLGRIAYALVELGGQMLYAHVESYGWTKGKAPVIMRIALPIGNKDKFETMTGFPLTKPPQVQIGI